MLLVDEHGRPPPLARRRDQNAAHLGLAPGQLCMTAVPGRRGKSMREHGQPCRTDQRISSELSHTGQLAGMSYGLLLLPLNSEKCRKKNTFKERNSGF